MPAALILERSPSSSRRKPSSRDGSYAICPLWRPASMAGDFFVVPADEQRSCSSSGTVESHRRAGRCNTAGGAGGNFCRWGWRLVEAWWPGQHALALETDPRKLGEPLGPYGERSPFEKAVRWRRESKTPETGSSFTPLPTRLAS